MPACCNPSSPIKHACASCVAATWHLCMAAQGKQLGKLAVYGIASWFHCGVDSLGLGMGFVCETEAASFCAGCHGAFLCTDHWAVLNGATEIKHATNMFEACRAAGGSMLPLMACHDWYSKQKGVGKCKLEIVGRCGVCMI